DAGPGFVAAGLRSYQREMEAWEAAAAQKLPELRQDAETLREIMNRQLDDVERTQKGFSLFGKQEKLRQAWGKGTDSLYSYLAAGMKVQAIGHLQRRELLRELTDQFRKVITLPLRRLEQMQAAFTQEAADLEKTWKEMAASSPSVNGKVYFEPEPPSSQGTVSQVYFQLL